MWGFRAEVMPTSKDIGIDQTLTHFCPLSTPESDGDRVVAVLAVTGYGDLFGQQGRRWRRDELVDQVTQSHGGSLWAILQ